MDSETKTLTNESTPFNILAKKRLMLVLLVSIALMALSFVLDSFPRTSGDVHSLFPQSSIELSNFEDVNKLFGNHLNDIVVVATGDKLSLETREQLFELEEELRELKGIEDVISPASAFSKKIKPPLPLKSEVKSTSRFILKVDRALGDTERARLNAEINQVLINYPDLAASRTGPFFISESVTSVIEKETLKRTPFTLLALLLVTSFLLKSIVLAVLVLLAPVLGVVWTVFGAALFGVALGPVSQLVPPFVLAVGASYSIHVATRLLRSQLPERGHVQKELLSAVSIAAATTIVGVSSLYLMDVRGVQEFALLAAVGVFLSANFALLLTPVFVSKNNLAEFKLPRFLLNPHKWLVLMILAVSVFAGFGLPQIIVHTEPMMFLPSGSWERAQIDESLESFPGNRLLSVVFKRSSEKLTGENLDLIAKISNRLALVPNIYSTVSDRDFSQIRKAKKDFSLTAGDKEADAPNDITLEDMSASRVLLETDLEGAELMALEEDVKSLVDYQLQQAGQSGNINFYVSGIELLLAKQTNSIVRGIIRSLVFTLLVVSVILLFMFRDVLLLFIGLVPNVIPIVTVLGAIGWIYQDINLGASLVGAAALSIAVDNTFHFLISWRENRAKNKSSPTQAGGAVLSSMRQCFASFISTSFVLSTAFGVMAASSVLPVQQFGLLLAITLLVGVMADTIVLPYLVSWYEKK